MIDALKALKDQIAQLERWKAEHLTVTQGVQFQAVAKALNMPLGKDIGPAILPGILDLQQRLAATAEVKRVLHEYLALSSLDGKPQRQALRERLKELIA